VNVKLKFYLALLLMVPFFLNVVAQEDDFGKSVEKLIDSREHRFSVINYAFNKYRHDSIKMKQFARISNANKYSIGESYAYNMLGKIYRMNTDYPEAIHYHQNAYVKAVEAKDTVMQVYSLNMLGVVYRRMDAVKSALQYHDMALELARKKHRQDKEILDNIAISHNSIGNIYVLLNRDDMALLHFNKALGIEKKFNNKLGLAINYQNIGSIYENEGDLNKALEYYEKSLGYNEQIHSKVGKIICNNSIGEVYIKKGEPKKALKIILPSLDIAEQLGDDYYLSGVYLNLGRIYTGIGNYKEAEHFLREGLGIAKENNIVSYIADGYQYYAELKEKQGRYKEALVFQKKFTDEKNMILNEKNQQLVSDLIVKQIKKENDEKIQQLGDENIQVKNKLKKTKSSIYIMFAVFALLTILSLIYYFQSRIEDNRKLMNMEQNLLRAQMNPHFIFNSLNSIKLYIINNDKRAAVTYLNKFAKLIRTILLSTTTEKETTVAKEIETLKLYTSIENIRMSETLDFSIDIDDTLDIEHLKIPSMLTQPFVENAIWHGLATIEGKKELKVKIYPESINYYVVEIEDNGIGRERAMEIKQSKIFKKTSIGISLSEERLENFSKKFNYPHDLQFIDLYDEKGKPKGTKVIIKIPY